MCSCINRENTNWMNKNEWMEGRMDKWMNEGWIDEWMEGRMNG